MALHRGGRRLRGRRLGGHRARAGRLARPLDDRRSGRVPLRDGRGVHGGEPGHQDQRPHRAVRGHGQRPRPRHRHEERPGHHLHRQPRGGALRLPRPPARPHALHRGVRDREDRGHLPRPAVVGDLRGRHLRHPARRQHHRALLQRRHVQGGRARPGQSAEDLGRALRGGEGADRPVEERLRPRLLGGRHRGGHVPVPALAADDRRRLRQRRDRGRRPGAEPLEEDPRREARLARHADPRPVRVDGDLQCRQRGDGDLGPVGAAADERRTRSSTTASRCCRSRRRARRAPRRSARATT